MFTLGSPQRFFSYGGAVDMRKGFDGLSGLVRNSLDQDPLSGEVYIFLNRSRTLVKLLHWGAGGMVGTGLLASILTRKYVDHLPLYRQLQRFRRENIPITTSTVDGRVRQGLERPEYPSPCAKS